MPAYWEQNAVLMPPSLLCDSHLPSLPYLLLHVRGAEVRKIELCDFLLGCSLRTSKVTQSQMTPWTLIPSIR